MPSLPEALGRLLSAGRPVIVAIDGPCGAGKSTLAGLLRRFFPDARVFPLDAFFLPPALRSPRRLALPGGNSHSERFLKEVLIPLKTLPAFAYRAYDCRRDSLRPVAVTVPRLAVVEGSYSMHPLLRPYYDYSVFLDISPGEQLARLKRRETAAGLERFLKEWIPLEEEYFREMRVASACSRILSQPELADLSAQASARGAIDRRTG